MFRVRAFRRGYRQPTRRVGHAGERDGAGGWSGSTGCRWDSDNDERDDGRRWDDDDNENGTTGVNEESGVVFYDNAYH